MIPGVETVKYINLLLESPPPAELERFWASSKQKKWLQILSREFFKQKAQETNLTLVLSGKSKFINSSIEEADSRLIQQLLEDVKCEIQRKAVIFNNTDVVVYCLTYENRCRFHGCKKVFIVLEQEKKPWVFPFIFWQINWEIIYHLRSFLKHMCLLGVM